MGAQLTIFDALDELEREQVQQDGMRRLGDGPELGDLLLMPLRAKGWRLRKTRAFGGSPHRWLFVLYKGTLEVKREGETLGDVVIEIFEEASKMASAAA